jgi:hypothetical protein
MKEIILILLLCIFLLGCASPTLGPEPNSPEYYINVSIDSNPSGADVYLMGQDGPIGEKIGTTPFIYKAGFAVQYLNYAGGIKEPNCEKIWLWGMKWGETNYDGKPAILDIVVAKDGYKSERTLTTLYTKYFTRNPSINWPPSTEKISISVPLERKLIK